MKKQTTKKETGRVKSFEESCERRGYDAKALPGVENLPPHLQSAVTSFYKMMVNAEALNEGKERNYTDSREWKYEPIFTVDATQEQKPGVGLSFCDTDFWDTFAFVGSRLAFFDPETTKYAANTFKEDYENIILSRK